MSNNDFTEDMIRAMLSQMGSVPIIFSVGPDIDDIVDDDDDVQIVTINSDEDSLIEKSEELIEHFSEESENEIIKPDSIDEKNINQQTNNTLPKSESGKESLMGHWNFNNKTSENQVNPPKQINFNDLINMIPLLGKQENLFTNTPLTQNKPVKKKIIEEFNKSKSKQESNDDDKIILNVGGKKFNIKREWLDLLHINNQKLHRINQDGK